MTRPCSRRSTNCCGRCRNCAAARTSCWPSARDIEIVRAELRAEREKYTQLFDGAPDPYLVTDADLRILSANRAGADLFNISQRFLSGKSLSVFLSKDRGRFIVEAARLASAGESADWAFAIRPRERAPLQVKARVVVHATDEGVELHWILRPA